MKNELSLKQALEQKLSLKQKLGLELLVRNSLELENYIKQEMEINPFLEPNFNAEDKISTEQLLPDGTASENWNSYIKSSTSYLPKDYNKDFILEQYASSPNWREDLENEIRLSNFSEKEIAVFMDILDNLNEFGFLENEKQIKKKHKLSDEEFERFLTTFMIMAPPGVGARNKAESYKFQLTRLGIEDQFLFEIIDKYADTLEGADYDRILTNENVPEERRAEIKHLLARLVHNPLFQVEEEHTGYIVPDIIIKRYGDELRPILNEKYDSYWNLNKDYVELMKKKSTAKNGKTFLRQYYNRYKIILEALISRKETLEKLAYYILEKQKDFFEKGPKYIKPMTRTEVAEALNRHPSTISRAVKHKYIETEFGIFPLAIFFSSNFSNKKEGNDENQSKMEILQEIKNIVDNEDKKKPYTDEQIANMLSEKGYKISRRAVNKYRGILKIPPRKERRV